MKVATSKNPGWLLAGWLWVPGLVLWSGVAGAESTTIDEQTTIRLGILATAPDCEDFEVDTDTHYYANKSCEGLVTASVRLHIRFPKGFLLQPSFMIGERYLSDAEWFHYYRDTPDRVGFNHVVLVFHLGFGFVVPLPSGEFRFSVGPALDVHEAKPSQVEHHEETYDVQFEGMKGFMALRGLLDLAVEGCLGRVVRLGARYQFSAGNDVVYSWFDGSNRSTSRRGHKVHLLHGLSISVALPSGSPVGFYLEGGPLLSHLRSQPTFTVNGQELSHRTEHIFGAFLVLGAEFRLGQGNRG